MNRLTAGIVLFDDIEVLDFCGPFEVFSVTRLDEGSRATTASPIEVVLVAQTLDAVTTAGGMRVLPAATFWDCPPLDLLVVPGGQGTRREMLNEAMLGFVRARAASTGLVASVCTGALILARAGLLEGRRATTHWRALDLLRRLGSGITVDDAAQVADEGDVMTSAGIAAGIDLALRIVARHFGEEVARATARHMEYPFPEHDRRHP